MNDKYYTEKLRFFTEILKAVFSLILAVGAGIVFLIRQEKFKAVDMMFLEIGIVWLVILISFTFILFFLARDVLKKLKLNDQQ